MEAKRLHAYTFGDLYRLMTFKILLTSTENHTLLSCTRQKD